MKLNGLVVAMLMLGSAALAGCKSAEEPPSAQTQQGQAQAQECPSQTAEVAAAPPPAPSATDTSANNDDQQQPPPKRHRKHRRGHRQQPGMGS